MAPFEIGEAKIWRTNSKQPKRPQKSILP